MTDVVTDQALQDASLAAQAGNPVQDGPAVIASVVVDEKPKTPVVEVTSTQAEADDKGEPAPIVWPETGDPGLDMALEFFGKHGIDSSNPAFRAVVDKGDFSLLEAMFASKGVEAKGWEKYLALAQRAYQDDVEADKAKSVTIATAVHAVVGGAEQWATIQAWAKTEASPEEKASLNAMLTADPVQARAAAMLIAAQFEKRGGTVVNPASATRYGASSNGVPSPATPLTRREATVETQALARRIGSHNLNNSPEYRAIWARVPSAR